MCKESSDSTNLFYKPIENRLAELTDSQISMNSFSSMRTYSIQDNDKIKRTIMVECALELLSAEAQAGIRIVDSRAINNKNYNPVKQYADWIEQALEILDGKSNPSPADE